MNDETIDCVVQDNEQNCSNILFNDSNYQIAFEGYLNESIHENEMMNKDDYNLNGETLLATNIGISYRVLLVNLAPCLFYHFYDYFTNTSTYYSPA